MDYINMVCCHLQSLNNVNNVNNAEGENELVATNHVKILLNKYCKLIRLINKVLNKNHLLLRFFFFLEPWLTLAN